jgi:hypothetical protein
MLLNSPSLPISAALLALLDSNDLSCTYLIVSPSHFLTILSLLTGSDLWPFSLLSLHSGAVTTFAAVESRKPVCSRV